MVTAGQVIVYSGKCCLFVTLAFWTLVVYRILRKIGVKMYVVFFSYVLLDALMLNAEKKISSEHICTPYRNFVRLRANFYVYYLFFYVVILPVTIVHVGH